MEDVDELSRNFWTAPLIGLFYGLIAGSLFWLLHDVFGGLVSATIVILVVHMLNRFLHFDGLIDLGDGLVATGTQEKRLAAMKDTRVGAGGVSYGVMFTLLIVASLASLPGVAGLLFFVPLAMEVLAKNGLVSAASLGREREGLGSPFVKNAGTSAMLMSTALSFAIVMLLATLFVAPRSGFLVAIFLAFCMVLASVVAGVVVSVIATRAFGCVNGDVMGATNELSKAAVLLATLAVLAWL